MGEAVIRQNCFLIVTSRDGEIKNPVWLDQRFDPWSSTAVRYASNEAFLLPVRAVRAHELDLFACRSACLHASLFDSQGGREADLNCEISFF